MSSLKDFSDLEFEQSFSSWEVQLRQELKLGDVRSKMVKNLVSGGTWPTLSIDSALKISLPVEQKWKKASQTYFHYSDDRIQKDLSDDLENGVRVFFLDSTHLSLTSWEKINSLFMKHPDSQDVVVIFRGQTDFVIPITKINVIDDRSMSSGYEYEKNGGDVISELSLMMLNFSKNEKKSNELYLSVYLGSHFFENIAKIRAARMLGLRMMEVLGIKKKLNIISMTSYRDWTLFESYSNILRNNAAVSSALIGGADYIQSSGHDSIFEIELGKTKNVEEHERSMRLARNTCHILSLESMLGMVQDAAYGSFHLESLSEYYAKSSWEKMQKLHLLSEKDLTCLIEKESQEVQKKRIEAINKRKLILSGINDFPDIKEDLALKDEPQKRFFRVARNFEELRLKVMRNKNRPVVKIALFGDLASLNVRINFVKNYFEVAGFVVHPPGRSCFDLTDFMNEDLKDTQSILVICAQDEDYGKLPLEKFKNKQRFIAGKKSYDDYKNIFMGQDIYQVLFSLVQELGLYE